MRFHRCSALRQTGQTISPFVGLASQASQTSQASQGFGCRGLGVRWDGGRGPHNPDLGQASQVVALLAMQAMHCGGLCVGVGAPMRSNPIPSPPEAFRRTGCGGGFAPPIPSNPCIASNARPSRWELGVASHGLGPLPLPLPPRRAPPSMAGGGPRTPTPHAKQLPPTR